LCVTIGLSFLSPVLCLAQSTDADEAEDALDPTGRPDLEKANEAHDASDGSVDEAAAAAASLSDEEEEEDEQFLSASELSEEALDARLNTLDAYLADLQRPSRLYWYGWLTTQTVLVAGQTLLALNTDEKPVKTGYIVGASVSGASLVMILISPFPGRYASSRYRAMSTSSREQKELKLAAGEGWLMAQAKQDALRTAWPAHVLGAVVAAGTGIGLAAAYEHNLKDAVTRTISIFLVSQLQVLTRPKRSLQYAKSYSSSPSTPTLALVPTIDRFGQGISLAGSF
jgi:hypothetical protein